MRGLGAQSVCSQPQLEGAFVRLIFTNNHAERMSGISAELPHIAAFLGLVEGEIHRRLAKIHSVMSRVDWTTGSRTIMCGPRNRLEGPNNRKIQRHDGSKSIP